MQTIYYGTKHYIRHTGNVVDLEEYRRKLALAQEGSLAPQPMEESPVSWEEDEEPQVLPSQSRTSPQGRLHRFSMMLDLCASLCVVIMTLTVAFRVF